MTQIAQYPQAASVGATDKVLLQQGAAGVPYTYAPVQQLQAPSTNGSVSAAGTTQGTATVLSSLDNAVTTCAAGAGVQVPSIFLGLWVTLLNTTANDCLVYPPSGAQWASYGTNVGVAVAPGGVASFKLFSGTQGYIK